jgi:hypothetical protein
VTNVWKCHGFALARFLLMRMYGCAVPTITFFLTVSRRFTMSDQRNQVTTVAALVAGGAVIGAGIGLLFAPKAGAETRREVGRYAKKAKLQTTRWSRAVQSGVKEVMDRRKLSSHAEDERPQIEAA